MQYSFSNYLTFIAALLVSGASLVGDSLVHQVQAQPARAELQVVVPANYRKVYQNVISHQSLLKQLKSMLYLGLRQNSRLLPEKAGLHQPDPIFNRSQQS